MKVSIVTICLNQAEFVEEAIRSVLDQDYPDIEYIVIDAGSTDGSREIIEGYRHRISQVIFEPDKGPVDGLNKGLRKATGDVFGYINADDFYLPGAISRMVEEFRKAPNADVLYGHGLIVDARGEVIRRFRSAYFTPYTFVYGGWVVCQQATFLKRKSVLKVGGFDVHNGTGWDVVLLVDLGLSGHVLKRVNATLGAFRIHPGSITGSQRLIAEHIRMKHKYFVKAIGREPRYSDHLIRIGMRVLRWMFDPLGFIFRVRDALRPPIGLLRRP